MEYSAQRLGPIYILREHESGGFGAPWTGWSCVVERQGDTGIVHAAPGKPKEFKKTLEWARSEGFKIIKWRHEGARSMHEVVIHL